MVNTACERALTDIEREIGTQWLRRGDDALEPYRDPYSPGLDDKFRARAAVLPGSVEEVSAIVRIAAHHGVPLWTISRGKNLGYGGPAPRIEGAVIVDLGRLNRVIEVDQDLGYAIIEPGVTFFDLYERLQELGGKLWASVPALGWGSVVGNALERGFGYTPYGDHSENICGLEVVLGDGQIVRTGLGAHSGSKTWPIAKAAYGPSLDGLFLQSNNGIVTKMGIWLMPQPEAFAACRITFPQEDQLGQIIDILRPLRLSGAIQSSAVLANAVRIGAATSSRGRWFGGTGPMPQQVIHKIISDLDIGWWNLRFGLYGPDKLIDFRIDEIRSAFAGVQGARFDIRRYHPGDDLLPGDSVMAGVPGLAALQAVKWLGPNGGHLSFSPISPPIGRDAVAQYQMAKAAAEEHGFDYYGGFTAGARHLNHIFLILFSKDDAAQCANARKLFRRLVADAAALGYGEYRTHVAFMDDVRAIYDFNQHALTGLSQKIKAALDPAGVLSPGKQGIWPPRYSEVPSAH